MKPRTAAFSKVRVNEPFNVLQRTVEYKFKASAIYVYEVDETALTTFLITRKSDMENWEIADFVNLNCEERNRYSSSLLCQRCWLLCTSYGDKKRLEQMKA